VRGGRLWRVERDDAPSSGRPAQAQLHRLEDRRQARGATKATERRSRSPAERRSQVKGYTQNGNDVLNAALDRFALDVAKEALSARERSAYINRAAAIVSPKCYLCFQALEANRPTGAAAKLPCD